MSERCDYYPFHIPELQCRRDAAFEVMLTGENPVPDFGSVTVVWLSCADHVKRVQENAYRSGRALELADPRVILSVIGQWGQVVDVPQLPSGDLDNQ